MAVALEAVVKQLKDSGIIAPGKLEDFIPPKAHPKDAAELARELVKSGNLTPFQGHQVLNGKVKALFLGNYTILDKLGAGGMGQVFKAQHRRMDRLVALKMLPAKTMQDAAAVARFEREVRAAAKLRHPNIVAADDADEANGVHFLVMEFVEGRDLSALVKKGGPFSVEKAVNCVIQAARGLEFAHSEGVVHRDIKPANLLLDKKGTVKILDMGLARIDVGAGDAAAAELTGTGAIMGTVDYMAPEQGVSTKDADARADIYSLGCTLHFLLTGKPVYEGESVAAKLLAHHHQPIPDLCKLRGDVPQHVQQVFEKMVAKKREDRYQTMNDVIAALQTSGVHHDQSLSMQTFGGPVERDTFTFLREAPAAPATHKPEGTKKTTSAGRDKGRKKLLYGIVPAAVLGVTILAVVIFKMQVKDGTMAAKVAPPAAIKETAVAATAKPNASPTKPTKPWETPEFQKWVADTQKLPAEQQIEAVSKKLVELNPGFDGKLTGDAGRRTPEIENGVVTELRFDTDDLIDLSPLRALFGLKTLVGLGGLGRSGRLADLSPLEGMQLTRLLWINNRVSDLSPLRGMPLEKLSFAENDVSDISPLEGMPLTWLSCGGTQVSNLSPLRRMPLAKLECSRTKVSDLSPLHDCKNLILLDVTKTKVTAAAVAALQEALPNCKIEWDDPARIAKPWESPAFQQWVKATQALPAEQQLKVVSKKLLELNPGFDGPIKEKVERGVVTELQITSPSVVDISPVRALGGLKVLRYYAGSGATSRFSDLSPLQGMQLSDLRFNGAAVSDLSPLHGMPLTILYCSFTPVSNLSPLKGLPLTELDCHNTRVSDLAPLHGMQLTSLDLGSNAQVSNLSALEGMPLKTLSISDTSVSDLSPVHGMRLSYFLFTPKNITNGLDIVRQMESLTTIGTGGYSKSSPAEFWKKYDAGDFGKPAAKKLAYLDPAFQKWLVDTQKLPAEKQIEAVRKKLMELNPGFDGKVTDASSNAAPKVEDGVVTEFGFHSDNITDLSPVRVFVGLRVLPANGSRAGQGKLSDLSPLRGMKLEGLYCGGTRVSDLSPVEGMALSALLCGDTQIANLSPLEGMPLTKLSCHHTQVSDLSPLEGMKLNDLLFTPIQITKGLDIIRHMKSLKTIGTVYGESVPPGEFWKKYDAGEFGKRPAYLDPAFQQWVTETQKLTAQQQVEAVSKKLMELNPGFDGKVTDSDWKGTPRIVNGVVTQLEFASDSVTDISPVRALAGLKRFACRGGGRESSHLADLSPLTGLPLVMLVCANTSVSDLSSLKDMKLTRLHCYQTQVSDLSPLQRMPLTELLVTRTLVSDLSSLSTVPTLRALNVQETNITAAQVAALQKALPNCQIEWDDPSKAAAGVKKLAYLDPAFQQWLAETQELTAQQQVEAVSKKLMELNPGFDGKVTGVGGKPMPNIENGVVVAIAFLTNNVTDISPVRALAGLRTLYSHAVIGSKCSFSDLSPLAGMPLTTLSCVGTRITDVSPLESCKRLAILDLRQTNVSASSKAAIQKALPNCKIEWDDPAKAGAKKLAYLDPAFQRWVEATQQLPAEQQIEAVSKKLVELNPSFDGTLTRPEGNGAPQIDNGVVSELGFNTNNVTDISPVRAFDRLRRFNCNGSFQRQGKLLDLSPLQGLQLTWLKFTATQVAALSALKGMPLTSLDCGFTQVSDLKPLIGMPLKTLLCYGTNVSDLSPLRDLPLKELNCGGTKVFDLSPLRGMELTAIFLDGTLVSDVSPLEGMKLYVVSFTPANIETGLVALRQMRSLQSIQLSGNGSKLLPAEFWKKYDAGEFGNPAPKRLAYLDPAFQRWVADTQKLPAEQQIEAVSKKLIELNPGFDGRLNVSPRVKNGVVIEFRIRTDRVSDISPIRVFRGLRFLECSGSYEDRKRGQLSDLSPIQGMPLTTLRCYTNPVSDLSPVRGMKLTILWVGASNVSDLSPLAGMPLSELNCGTTKVSDLQPLQGMPLTTLCCDHTQVSEFSPLFGCKSLKALKLGPYKTIPAQIAALQKALPNCKIEWDGNDSASRSATGGNATAPAGNK